MFLPADRNTGRLRGFAFVEFTDEAAAIEAIERFDGHEFKGRSLRVTEAEDRRPRSRIAFDGAPPFGDRGQRRSKPKRSRRNIRGKKRSL